MARSIILASSFLPFFVLLLPMPLAADVVPISVFQQVSVSGGANACDETCQMFGIAPPSPGQSFSTTQKNTALPSKNLSVSQGVTDDDSSSFFVRTASASADANQSVAPTANGIQVNLEADDTLSSSTTLVAGAANASSQYALTFDLTSPYLVSLTGSISGETDQEGGFLVGPFDGEIHLTGAGAPFDQVLSCAINSFCSQAIGATIALGPGVYTLDAESGLNASGGFFLDATSQIDLSLNANFIAIPEPEWMPLVVGLLTLVGLRCARRRRTSSDY